MDPAMDVVVRWLTEHDADTLRQFCAVLPRGRPLSDAEQANLLSGETAEILTATVDGQPAGWAVTYVLPYVGGGEMVLFYDLEVLAAYRRRGIGRRLVTEVRDNTRRRARSRLWLITAYDNTPAVQLYRDLGGTETPDTMFTWVNLPDSAH